MTQKERGEVLMKLTPLVLNKPIPKTCQYIQADFAFTGISEIFTPA